VRCAVYRLDFVELTSTGRHPFLPPEEAVGCREAEAAAVAAVINFLADFLHGFIQGLRSLFIASILLPFIASRRQFTLSVISLFRLQLPCPYCHAGSFRPCKHVICGIADFNFLLTFGIFGSVASPSFRIFSIFSLLRPLETVIVIFLFLAGAFIQGFYT